MRQLLIRFFNIGVIFLTLIIHPSLVASQNLAEQPSATPLATPLIEKPWLKNHLPSKITAYVRIPHLLFFFSQDDTPLAPLYSDPRYINSIRQIKAALVSRLSTLKIDEISQNTINLFASHLRAPVEILIPEIVNLTKPPAIVIATKLDYQNPKAFEKDFTALITRSSMSIDSITPTTGKLKLSFENITGKYHYSVKTGKLLITFGELNKDHDYSSEVRTPSPIKKTEAIIDKNGQGLIAVFRPSPFMFMMLPLTEEEKIIFPQLALNQISEISLGLGVTETRPQFNVMLNMPNVGLRQLIPSYPFIDKIRYHGRLLSYSSISLPNEELINRVVSIFNVSGYDEFKLKILDRTGVTFSDLLALFGRNYAMFSDDNGSYVAVKNDFAAKLIHITKKIPSLDIESFTMHGMSINHLNLTPLYTEISEQAKTLNKYGMDTHLFSVLTNNHLYWIKEGDIIVLSYLPQPLFARKKLNPSHTIDWNKSYQINQSKNVISHTRNYRNLSQAAYYRQLSILNRLGDMANVSVNIAEYPLAETLDFKRYGSIGFRINNSGESISVNFHVENGLLDIAEIINQAYGKFSSIWMAGIISAAAVPSYQDYTIKVKIAASIASLKPLKKAISDELLLGKEPKDVSETSYSSLLTNINEQEHIQVSIKEAKILVKIKNLSKSVDNSFIYMQPNFSDNTFLNTWKCDALDIPAKFRPETCR